MPSRILASLQFKLVVGFAAVLALTLAGVSFYIGRVADREAVRLEEDVEEVRQERIEKVITGIYRSRFNPLGLQQAIENASSFYGWRVIVNDPHGRLVADSHHDLDTPLFDPSPTMRRINILTGGRPVASVWISVHAEPEGAGSPEPRPSRLVDDLNRSPMWSGLAAGLGGVLLVTLLSRSVLTPVRALGRAARGLGAGDLTHRVEGPGHDEIGDLSRTFNAMAEGLEIAESRRRDLMADIAHELRTPLSNIQGYLEAVRDGIVEPDEETNDTIYQQARQLSRLIEDLRVLALAEAGALRLELAETSMGNLLKETVDAFRPRVQSRGLLLNVHIDEHLPTVVADRARIAQVVGNLIDNAITHSPEGGIISVTGEPIGGSSVRVSVADTGPGIPPGEIDMVFERLYRTDPSRSRATGDAGLGLTIAKQLIEAHRGAIRVESRVGEGSRFIFELSAGAPLGHDG